MSLNVTFKSNRLVVERRLEAIGRAAMHTGGEKFRTLLVRNLKGKRTGIKYLIPGSTTGKQYTASAPHEYPAVRLGMISGPGGYQSDVWSTFTHWGVSVGSRFAHAEDLETRPISQGGRPHLKRTYDENRGEILAAFVRGFRVAAAVNKGI